MRSSTTKRLKNYEINEGKSVHQIYSYFQICFAKKALGSFAIAYKIHDLESQENFEKIEKPIERSSDRKKIFKADQICFSLISRRVPCEFNKLNKTGKFFNHNIFQQNKKHYGIWCYYIYNKQNILEVSQSILVHYSSGHPSS